MHDLRIAVLQIEKHLAIGHGSISFSRRPPITVRPSQVNDIVSDYATCKQSVDEHIDYGKLRAIVAKFDNREIGLRVNAQ